MGIVIGTNEPEAAWNALRFCNTALVAGHTVRAFLMNSGVEIGRIKSKKYDVSDQLSAFTKNGGRLLACGTCMKSRNQKENKTCPVSSMQDLLKMVEDSDRVLTFG